MVKSPAKYLLLLDGVGAFISFVFLGGLLPVFPEVAGMPINVLYTLSFIALVYSVFSLVSFIFSKSKWPKFLRTIAIANLVYCALTGLLVMLHFQNLTLIGKSYFYAEIVLICGLVIFEWKHSKALSAQT